MLCGLAKVAGRELAWGLREVARETGRWRSVAAAIPDPRLRADALLAIERKRANLDGAALFWTIPRSRSKSLLRLLVAYEILADYLDCTSERAADAGVQNGLQLHQALVDAIDPSCPPSDYYRHHPWYDDGGYVALLVRSCREGTERLPSYGPASRLAIRAAELAKVLALNHEPDGILRESLLRCWVENNPGAEGLSWFEWSAAASAWLTVLALLAISADPNRSAPEADAVFAAYLPWIALAGTMLDSYGDAAEDKTGGDHSYIAYYRTRLHADARLAEIVATATRRAGALPDGERHAVLTSAMVAMYLTKDSAWTSANRRTTWQLARSAGPLTMLLLPVLRTWRVVNGETSDRSSGPASAPVSAAQRRLEGTRTDLPPSPRVPPLIQTLAFWRDPHAYLAWCHERYGARFTVRALGMAPLVFVSDPDHIKAIVRAPPDVLHPGAGAAVIAPLVGEDSFMLAEEADHLGGRRKALLSFRHARVHSHTQMLEDIVNREMAGWPRDKVVALHPYLRALTLHVILHTLFGAEYPEHAELHRRLFSMLTVTGSLALQEPQLRQIPPWRGLWRRLVADRHEVDRLLRSLTERATNCHASGVLPMLVDRQGDSSPKQLRADLMSLILAGHETTASELAWAFQLLAHNPWVAMRLARSLDEGRHEYLDATVLEVLRHRPVFLFTIPRVVNAPFELAGVTFTSPTQLVGCIHLMHHDDRLYPQPECFRPERFLVAGPHSDLWLPWGGGRKRCPGHHLALLEMATVLKLAMSRLEVQPCGPLETARWRSVIVTPGRGSRVLLRERKPPRIASATHTVASPLDRRFLT
jgi:tetraprenyl-beta-curcumene synthase